MPSNLLAVIPFYKRRDQLDRCLAALAASDVPITPAIHDNSDTNIGYTRAVNLGLKAALEQRHTFALVLNQDCYIRPDTVRNLIAFMDAHPRCAIAGPKQVSPLDEDHIEHAGGTEAYPTGRQYIGRKSEGKHATSGRMAWVSGAAMFARLSAVVEFGLLDENLVMVGSDSDWCYTARSRNWEVWYCAEAEVVHKWNVTSNPPAEMISIFNNDMAYWRDKWVGPNLYARLYKQER